MKNGLFQLEFHSKRKNRLWNILKFVCDDCTSGAAVIWQDLYQEYTLMPDEIQGRAYYQSRDGKWALSWSDSGWGLGVADQLGIFMYI